MCRTCSRRRLAPGVVAAIVSRARGAVAPYGVGRRRQNAKDRDGLWRRDAADGGWMDSSVVVELGRLDNGQRGCEAAAVAQARPVCAGFAIEQGGIPSRSRVRRVDRTSQGYRRLARKTDFRNRGGKGEGLGETCTRSLKVAGTVWRETGATVRHASSSVDSITANVATTRRRLRRKDSSVRVRPANDA